MGARFPQEGEALLRPHRFETLFIFWDPLELIRVDKEGAFEQEAATHVVDANADALSLYHSSLDLKSLARYCKDI